MPLKTKTPAPAKTDERSFAAEAYELLKRGFAQQGADLAPFCSQKAGLVKSIVSVREGGTLVGKEGIRFADGTLYVGRKVFDKYQKDPAGFARAAVGAVRKGLEEQARWKKGYTDLEEDRRYLNGLEQTLKAGGLDRAVVPSKTKEAGSELIQLEGSVYVPAAIHQLYAKLTYAKKGISLNEQAFAMAYMQYQRAREADEIKEGRFVIADFNLHASHKRFYLLDLSKPDQPKVLDTITVSHGVSSDPDKDGWIDTLSNQVDSHQSSQGLYRIMAWENRTDFDGIIWRLDGRDSTSSRAAQRGILIHLKRSDYTWGCFGLDPEQAKAIGLPLAHNMSGAKQKEALNGWVGVGVYVYYDHNVQKVCKKYWKPGK